MNTDISSTLADRPLQARVSAPRPACLPEKETAPKIELHAPQKSEIHYDPAEMRRNLEDAIQRLNEQMRQSARNLNFSIDEMANRTVITVRSTETGEVVRQIPNETVLNLAHNLEQIKGMLHNSKN